LTKTSKCGDKDTRLQFGTGSNIFKKLLKFRYRISFLLFCMSNETNVNFTLICPLTFYSLEQKRRPLFQDMSISTPFGYITNLVIKKNHFSKMYSR